MGKKRETKKIKRRMRRRGPGIFLTLFCLAVICAAILGALTVFFKVAEIEVSGESRYTPEQIKQALGIKIGENMFTINKFAAIDRVLHKCPYAGEVEIHRKLPDKLQVFVKDAVPAMQIESQNKWYIADLKGKILEQSDVYNPNIGCMVTGAELISPEISKKVIFLQKEKENPIYNILNVAKNNDILNKVKKIDIDKIYEIKIGYTDNFTVLLGTVEELDQKLKILEMVIEKIGSTQKGIIDVTDPAKVYFRPY